MSKRTAMIRHRDSFEAISNRQGRQAVKEGIWHLQLLQLLKVDQKLGWR